MTALPRWVRGCWFPRWGAWPLGSCADRQDDARATYAAKLDKAEAELNWTRSAELERRVRASIRFP